MQAEETEQTEKTPRFPTGDHDDVLLSMEEVMAYLKISRTKMWRMRQARDFPKPVPIGGSSVRWFYSDIRQWLKQRQEQACTY